MQSAPKLFNFSLGFCFFFLLAPGQAEVKLHLKFPLTIASYKSKVSTLKTIYFLKDWGLKKLELHNDYRLEYLHIANASITPNGSK